MTATRYVTTAKSAVLSYFAVEVWNHAERGALFNDANNS